MYTRVFDIAINSSTFTHVRIFMLCIKVDYDELSLFRQKMYIFTQNFFSMDFKFGNFLFKFLVSFRCFKILIERKLKILTLPQPIHISTVSFPLMGQISTISKVSSRRDQIITSFDSYCSVAIKE
jgi:hypothetical protein